MISLCSYNDYKEIPKPKRTPNLELWCIRVGDWAQVWNEETEKYSKPMKIIQICDDGTIYLISNEEERANPRKENIKNIDSLPITEELLKGFGFEFGPTELPPFKSSVYFNNKEICVLHNRSLYGYYFVSGYGFESQYFEDLIEAMHVEGMDVNELALH